MEPIIPPTPKYEIVTQLLNEEYWDTDKDRWSWVLHVYEEEEYTVSGEARSKVTAEQEAYFAYQEHKRGKEAKMLEILPSEEGEG